MNRDLNIRISIPPELLHWGLIGALLASLPASVGSEVVTLNTYYPAPYGIYTQMRTEGETTLGETADVAGCNGPGQPACNDVGIGTTAPASGVKLDVNGEGHFASYVGINQAADSSVGQQGSPSLGVNGVVAATQYLYASAGNAATCNLPTNTTDAQQDCGGGQYATWTPGVRVEGYWYSPKTYINPAWMYGNDGTTPDEMYIQTWDGTAWDPSWQYINDTAGDNGVIDVNDSQYYCCSPVSPPNS